MRRCVEGAPGARRALVVQFLRTVRQAAGMSRAVRTGRVAEADVDDAAQLVFITLFAEDCRVLRAWSGQASLRHYIRTIAARVAARHFRGVLRRHGRFHLGLDAAEDDDPTSALAQFAQQAAPEAAVDLRLVQEAERAALRAAIADELSERGRAVYEALFVEELEPAEVARRLGMTANNVYQYRNRIQRAARRVAARWRVEGAPQVEK